MNERKNGGYVGLVLYTQILLTKRSLVNIGRKYEKLSVKPI